ncbi:MAG TPA: HNH endonuclease [Xanthobacteraceae bacterium]|nr:HNH endonuclease [Xanthobacteraceae bacterium]
MSNYGKRDPSSHRTPEQIRAMDHGYNHTPEHIKGRSERNQARRIVAKRDGKAAIKGKDVDHKKMVKDGGTNNPSNLRVKSAHWNRGWRARV